MRQADQFPTSFSFFRKASYNVKVSDLSLVLIYFDSPQLAIQSKQTV